MRFSIFLLSLFVAANICAQRKVKPHLSENLYIASQVYFKSNEATMYVSINESDLLPSKNNHISQFQVAFKVHYSISGSGKKISQDTLTKIYKVNSSDLEFNQIIDSFPIGVRTAPFEYEVEITDLNKNEFNFIEKTVNPTRSFDPCYFIKRKLNGQVVIEPYFRNDSIKIFSEKYKGQSLKVSQFNSSKLPPPPFINRTGGLNLGSPDTTYSIQFDEKGQITIPNQKQIMILSGSELNLSNNYVVFGSENIFPYFENYVDLIEPLKFFTSREEYSALINSTNKRKAFESFWIKLAGSENQAKYMIGEFYKRVKYANKNFSSYKPGWKTDRGMMYIIYGEPEYIDESEMESKWNYESKFESSSSTYIFYKSRSEIDNDFELVRNSLFKSGWYLAVENWRSGTVYQK